MLIGIFVSSDQTTVTIQSPTAVSLIPLDGASPIPGPVVNGSAQLTLNAGIYKIQASQKLTVTGADSVFLDGKDERPDPTLTIKVMASLLKWKADALDKFWVIAGSRSA